MFKINDEIEVSNNYRGPKHGRTFHGVVVGYDGYRLILLEEAPTEIHEFLAEFGDCMEDVFDTPKKPGAWRCVYKFIYVEGDGWEVDPDCYFKLVSAEKIELV